MNPILQGIDWSNRLQVLKSLQSAVAAADPDCADPVLTPIRATLAEQAQRQSAELTALINLYGGNHAQ